MQSELSFYHFAKNGAIKSLKRKEMNTVRNFVYKIFLRSEMEEERNGKIGPNIYLFVCLTAARSYLNILAITFNFIESYNLIHIKYKLMKVKYKWKVFLNVVRLSLSHYLMRSFIPPMEEFYPSKSNRAATGLPKYLIRRTLPVHSSFHW